MEKTELRTVPFHGDEIVTFESDGTRWVAMKRIVENMGMDWKTQAAKLDSQKQKFSCGLIPTTGADGKTYNMLAIPVLKLQLWMNSINPNRVAESVRPKLEKYQTESAIALHDYWTKGAAVRSDLGHDTRDLVQSMINRAFTDIVERLVEAKFAASHGSYAPGISAGEVLEMAGFHDRKGLRTLPRYVSDKLRLYSARKKVVVTLAKNGIAYAYKFDAATARDWLSEGGRKEIEARIAERKGQNVLKLVPPKPKPK